MKTLCTLSDWNFLAKGIALYESLQATSSEEFVLYYLCLDKRSFGLLWLLKDKLNTGKGRLQPVSLEKLEKEDPALQAAKADRPYNQYCWTLASYFCNHIIHQDADVTYIDSDIFFYKDIDFFFKEVDNKSVGIIAHRHNHVGHTDGAYNVGVVYFKNDKVGRECLYWWADAVLTKKYPELQTCGDQKYLEQFIPRFGAENVCVVDQTIGHAAPWNYRLYGWDKLAEGTILWGGKEQPLIFNHFSRLSYDLAKEEINFTSGQYNDHTLGGQVFNIPQVRKLYVDYFLKLKEIHGKYLNPKIEMPLIKASPLKMAFGMIVLNGDHVLKQCLEAVYPYASQILIAEGPVDFWQKRGLTTSNDKTNEIIESFPDTHGKITVVHGQFSEKDDQCKAYMKFMSPDTDYLWNLDSDELFKAEDIETLYKLLEKEQYTSVGIKSCSFYGGFDRYVGGFEEQRDQFLRVFKVYPGSTWLTHRPPTVTHVPGTPTLPHKHLDSDTLYGNTGIRMYHYSYVFPRQIRNKAAYYESLASGKFIPNYYDTVYLPWVKGTDAERTALELKYMGVHEYRPEYRTPTMTKAFEGTHPVQIARDMHLLKEEFNRQLLEI